MTCLNHAPGHERGNSQASRERIVQNSGGEPELTTMNIPGLLFIGILAGVLARLLMPGKDHNSWWISLLLGIAGSFAGSLMGRVVDWHHPGEEAGLIMSVGGAMLLLMAWRLVTEPHHGERSR
jgi:uncharacterized membrane protein YeaQ/YmgE (transglycosylase-associated protein family)